MRRLETSEFILQAKEVHGDKFSYEKVNYLGTRIKVKIICQIHGQFTQLPKNHIHLKQGCPVCFGNKKLTTEEFIVSAKKKHNNRYDYNETIYSGNHGKLKISCKEHGIFEQTATRHLSGDGCPKCSINKRFLTTKEFIKKAKEKHGETYNYDFVEYKKNDIKIKIICKKHGVFEQKPTNHLSGYGCIKCKLSKGENLIMKILDTYNINYVRQKSFDDCKNKKLLKFDFYLESKKMLIEFDGQQHKSPIKYFGGEKKFETIKTNDDIKNDFVKSKNIKLLRITNNDYRSNRVEKILINNLIINK